jgi:hypothetical protein
MQFIFCLFEQVSRKINFHKTEIYYLGAAKERGQQYSKIFTCPTIVLPMKYLGMSIDEKILAVSQWDPIEENMGENWQARKQTCYPL